MFEKIEDGKPKRYALFTTRLEANKRLLEQHRLIKVRRQELEKSGLNGEELSQQIREYRRHVVTEALPIIQRFDPQNTDAKFLFSVKSGEMFLVRDKGEEKLVIFKSAASTSGQFWFIDQRDATKEPKFISKSGASYIDIICKKCVDRLGNTSFAND
jgi:hypothetical protein